MKSTESLCRNCQTELAGPYCHHCGQKEVLRRLSLGEILRDLPGKVFNLDRGLWLTFLCLFIRPGQVCLDYVRGKRHPYVNPLSYFLIGASLQLASLWFSAPLIRDSVNDAVNQGRKNPDQARMFERMDEMIGGDTATAMTEIYLTVIVQAYTYLALFACAVPLALALWLFHRRANYHFAEVLVFALYVVAHCLVVTAFTTPICARVGTTFQVLTAQGFYIGMVCWAHQGFFPAGIGRRVLTLLAMGLAMACFFTSIAILFGVSWGWYLFWTQWQA
jgi:hypothetical protein